VDHNIVVWMQTFGTAIVVPILTLLVGYWKFKKTTEETRRRAALAVAETQAQATRELAVQSKRIEEEVEESIWKRTQAQLDSMDRKLAEAHRKLEECETHRHGDQAMLWKMRVAMGSLELRIVSLIQELERNGLSVPGYHIVMNLGGSDDPLFAEHMERLNKMSREASSERPPP
jgi:ribosomal protein L31E